MDAPPPLPPFSFLPIPSNPVDSTTPPTSTSSHAEEPFNSPLPPLPVELKKEILRFCDPATLAKTSLVSLAFLEMSSPLLYEDVHVDGIEALRSLFSKRDSPPCLAIAPFLSLSQILNLTLHLPIQHLRASSQSLKDLSLDRSPSNSSLLLQQLQISAIQGQNGSLSEPPDESNEISLLPFVHLFDPLHLCLRVVPSENLYEVFEVGSLLWTRLQSLTLISISADSPLFEYWMSRHRPHLALVTYQIEEAGADVDRDMVVVRLNCMLEDQPMPEGVQVVVLVKDEEAKVHVLDQLRERVQSDEYGSDGERVLSQMSVEVKR